MRAAPSVCALTLALSAPIVAGACGWLAAGAAGDGGSGLPQPARHDGGALDDGGPRRDASTPNDAGSRDGGRPLDGGVPPDVVAQVDAGLLDAGSDDAGSDDAGSVDAGTLDGGPVDASAGAPDAGEAEDAGVVDPPAPDAGPPSPFRVLGLGSSLGTATVAVAPSALEDLDTVLLFLSREQVLPPVELPGNWSGSTYGSRDDGEWKVVGATRHFQDDPALLAGPLTITVGDEEPFSYALVGVIGLGSPDDADADNTDTTAQTLCAGTTAVLHELGRGGDPFHAVVAFAHRRAPAAVVGRGALLAHPEVQPGPSLLVQELRVPEGATAEARGCLGGPGPYVSLVKYFDLP